MIFNSQKEEKFYDKLKHGGKWLYRHNLIFYDEIFDEIDFNCKYWNIPERIVCFFIGHKFEKFYRLPKENKTGLPDKMGCVKAEICCIRCWNVNENTS